MQKNLLRYTLAGILFTWITGTLFHFVYEWSGHNFFVGLFAPVNESIWEHMKLIFFPMLFYFFWENKRLGQSFPSLSCNNIIAILAGTFLIPILFYTYSGILGTNYPILDISTFYISVAVAFILRFRLTVKNMSFRFCPLLAAVTFLLLLCFWIFTVYPPDLGIFISPV